MIRVLITRQSRYPSDTKTIKESVRKVLSGRGAQDCDISIALVGERKMKELSRDFLKEKDGVHEVLSFPASGSSKDGVDFETAEDSRLQLGDIVICYPEARKIAIKKNRMMDDVLIELAEHGTLHLLGIHHD
jgi:probable rRNA maturation factor